MDEFDQSCRSFIILNLLVNCFTEVTVTISKHERLTLEHHTACRHRGLGAGMKKQKNSKKALKSKTL